jgi:CRISPR-associated endonuclease/helicase Cas3
LAGLLHDFGKYTKPYQKRLQGGPAVDHATAGAKMVNTLAETATDRATAELIAYAISGHHGGLPDMHRETGSLYERLQKTLDPLDSTWELEIRPDATGLWPKGFTLGKDHETKAFQLSFLTRMIFSSLVDADFRDTERFYATAKGETVDRDWPVLPEIVDQLRDRLNDRLSGFDSTGKVNRLRREVMEYVRSQTGDSPGLFSLNVPTGGGKTLTSLAFALDHAKAHGLERIVYAIPFTSVIDQTAEIFRDVLGEGVVLEHHSAIDETKFTQREGADKLRLAMEDWAAPIVATTNVQLFESLFSHRPSRCRKLHNLARAVIVLDEAQTIPLHVLRPAVAVLDELARNYGSSIVLCTATQPALKAPEFKGGFEKVRELAPDPPRLHQQLARVTMAHKGTLSDDDLCDALAQTAQGMVIVNSRKHALDLFQQVCEADMEGVVHLTTRQYAAHRLRIIEDVKQRLSEGSPCRLLATSLVEAGVDLDFPKVWRAEAGLDSVAQAAGRCNREGERDIADSIVTVFQPAEHSSPAELSQLAGDMERIMGRHDDLLSPEAMEDYFQEVYWRKGKGLGDDFLQKFKMSKHNTSFSFREVGERFRLIQSELLPVIIDREEEAHKALRDLAYTERPGGVARRLQPYVVQVYPRFRKQLVNNKHVYFAEEERFGDQFAVLFTKSLYREDIGLLWEDADALDNEVMIV